MRQAHGHEADTFGFQMHVYRDSCASVAVVSICRPAPPRQMTEKLVLICLDSTVQLITVHHLAKQSGPQYMSVSPYGLMQSSGK